MYFYFDESGDFAIPSSLTTHKAAVVMGVVVSDLIHNELRQQFHRFVAGLDASECLKGEPKGARLSYAHRRAFCEMLTGYDGIFLTPVTLDLSSLSGSGEKQMTEGMYQSLCTSAEAMLYPEGRESMLLIARQYRNLSINQVLRIYSLANCIREALEHAIIFLANRGHEKAWEDVRFEIDRVQVRPNSREEKVFSRMVLAWLAGWSRSKPFTLVREIHTPDHPFVRKYDLSDSIDASKLVRDRIYWVDSSESWGVQMADIGATIVYQAAHATDDRDGLISLYASLMRKSPYGAKRGPGLFSPLEVSEITGAKYMLLSEAMRRRSSS
jgi:Protein of unknown function (DUF3800)